MVERSILHIVESPSIDTSDTSDRVENISFLCDWRELREYQNIVIKTGMMPRPTPGIWLLAQRGIPDAVDLTNRFRLMQKSVNNDSLQSSS
jgi:hypothetical protein